MLGTFSLGRTLVLATLVHLGLFAIASRATAPGSRANAIEPMKLVWVDATPEVEVEPASASPAEVAPNSPLDPSRTPVAMPRERIARATAPMTSAVALPASAPSASDEWTLHITSGSGTSAPSAPTLADLGLDGKNHFLGGSKEAPPRPAPDLERLAHDRSNRAAGEAMRGALHDGDVAKGLGSGGPVVAALEEAVLAGAVPVESHAVFIAIADASGIVTRVDIESASDDLAAFRAIAQDVLNRLREKRVRVPTAARGLSMRIDVSSGLALPSGAGAAGVGFDPRNTGMSFDFSDIGAHVGRMVHARILGEQLL